MEYYAAIQNDDVYKDWLIQILSHTCIYIYIQLEKYTYTHRYILKTHTELSKFHGNTVVVSRQCSLSKRESQRLVFLCVLLLLFEIWFLHIQDMLSLYTGKWTIRYYYIPSLKNWGTKAWTTFKRELS